MEEVVEVGAPVEEPSCTFEAEGKMQKRLRGDVCRSPTVASRGGKSAMKEEATMMKRR